VQRRQLFKLIAATSTATGSFSPLWLGAAAGSATRLDSYPFAYGVASGSPDASSVVLWTRLAPSALAADPSQSVPVRWELAHDAQFQRVVQSGTTSATAQLGHSVHVEVQGLQSDRWYHYRFMVGNAVSATGRTRTFPAKPLSTLRI
jgi:alkaline phosphatase D